MSRPQTILKHSAACIAITERPLTAEAACYVPCYPITGGYLITIETRNIENVSVSESGQKCPVGECWTMRLQAFRRTAASESDLKFVGRAYALAHASSRFRCVEPALCFISNGRAFCNPTR